MQIGLYERFVFANKNVLVLREVLLQNEGQASKILGKE